MSNDLDKKYRPRKWDEVVGQESVVDSLRDLVERKKAPHAYLFSGPSGTGKTTLARILARQLECKDEAIYEINAASNTGVDDMRKITSMMQYASLGPSSSKFVIVDEAHRLSGQAWDSMLKPVEEPPDHGYWAFCTTLPGKVPKTIKTRCHSYSLKPVDNNAIFDLLLVVREEEGIKLPDDALDLIVKNSEGSPRQALVFLSQCSGLENRQQVAELIKVASADNKEVIDFCRWLVGSSGKTWTQAMKILTPLKDLGAESIRVVVVNYLQSALLGCTSEKKVKHLLFLLDNFMFETYPNDKLGPILLAVGRVLYE